MTCRFSGGTSRPRGELPLPARRRGSSTVSSGSRRAQKSRIRSSAVHASGATLCRSSRLCDKSAHEVQRRDRRAAPDRLAVAREARAAAPARRPGRPHGGRRGRPASRPCRRPGPAMPVTDTADVGAEPLARAVRHRRRGLGRNGAVLARASRPGRRARPPSPRSAYATIAAEEDVARARDGGQPRRDQPAGARLGGRERQPPRAAALEHDLLDRRSSRANRYLLERRASAPLELVRARLGPRLDDEVDVDLEVACADRHLDAVAVPARVGERLRDRRLADP